MQEDELILSVSYDEDRITLKLQGDLTKDTSGYMQHAVALCSGLIASKAIFIDMYELKFLDIHGFLALAEVEDFYHQSGNIHFLVYRDSQPYNMLCALSEYEQSDTRVEAGFSEPMVNHPTRDNVEHSVPIFNAAQWELLQAIAEFEAAESIYHDDPAYDLYAV